MRYIFLFFTVLFFISTPAIADFNTAMSAYEKKEYSKAYREFKELAEQGDVESQFMLGFLYVRGSGVLQDFVQAHKWFNLTASRGKEGAAKARDEIAKGMTPEQVAEAQRLARAWKPTPPAGETQTEISQTASKGISQKDILKIQQVLTELGYDPGASDGLIGSKTRSAIQSYQTDSGLPVDGKPSKALIEHLQITLKKRLTERKVVKKPTESLPPQKEINGVAVTDKRTQEVLDQFKKLVETGTKERKADQDFLAELRELIRRYDWPWRILLFQDDFTDNDFTSNPSWSVASGEFRVDAYNRLQTRLRRSEEKPKPSSSGEEKDTAAQIFGIIMGEIMKEKQPASSQPPQPSKAEIYSVVSISNAFFIDIELLISSGTKSPRIEFGPYQGKQHNRGYRLNYVGGKTPFLELTRLAYGGSSVIDVSHSVPALDDGKAHIIQWRRYDNGDMIITVDKNEVIRTIDRAFHDPFEGITLVNHAGEYAIPSISIYGTTKK